MFLVFTQLSSLLSIDVLSSWDEEILNSYIMITVTDVD